MVSSHKQGPAGTHGTFESGYGVVIDNEGLRTDAKHHDFSLVRGRKQKYPLVAIKVAFNDDSFHAVFLPRVVAKDLNDFSLVYIRGQWRACQGRLYLMGLSLRRFDNPTINTMPSLRWRLRAPLEKCWYCHSSLNETDMWDFDSSGQPECQTCAQMRGNMRPTAFVHQCLCIGNANPPKVLPKTKWSKPLK